MAVIEHVEPFMDTRSSKGIVGDFQPSSAFGVYPEVDQKILLDMMRNDVVIASAFDRIVQAATHNGGRIEVDESFVGDVGAKIRRTEKKLQNLDWNEFTRNFLLTSLIYGDAFVEKRFLMGESGSFLRLEELHVMETSEMRIDFNEHGDVISYIQTPRRGGGLVVSWNTDEMAHMRLKKVGSKVYSMTLLEPIAKDFNAKLLANHYLGEIFRNLPPRILYHLKMATIEQRREFILNLQVAKVEPHADLVSRSAEGAEVKQLGPQFDNNLIKVLEYLRDQVAMITGVPLIWLGKSSARGEAEAQTRPFSMFVESFQQTYEDFVNKVLLPFIEPGTRWRFNCWDTKKEKEVLENASLLRQIGYEERVVEHYIREGRVRIPNAAKISDDFHKVKDDNPSRRRMDKQAGDKMNVRLDREGVSGEGGRKIEEAMKNAP